MASGEDGRVAVIERIVTEWPAALAVLVLAAGHVYLVVVEDQELAPLGLPLFLAIAVFIIAEIGRRLVGAN